MTIKEYSLKQKRTDPDFRVRYKDVEPLYFEIITCPGCFYSASANIFDKAIASIMIPRFNEAMKAYKTEGLLNIENDKEMDTVFAKYYLALECSKICFFSSELTTAKLWLRLSWLYSDCGDPEMQAYAENMALQVYLQAYEESDVDEAQLQRLCIIIAELSLRRGDIKTAKKYLLIVKTNKNSFPIYIRQASDRLENIKQMEL
jgi:hypothetical protein